MRKGAKRKASQKEEAKPAQENHQESKKATSQAKRVKASKPETEPEYFEDKRNLVDRLFLVLIYKFNQVLLYYTCVDLQWRALFFNIICTCILRKIVYLHLNIELKHYFD
jgi:hypothetical protein